MQGYRIGRCTNCGLVQIIDEIDEAMLSELYGKSYYEGENEYVYPDYLSKTVEKTRDYEWRLDTFCAKNNISRPGACLEIGCAFGLFLNVARSRGWKTKGIELSTHSATYARERFGLDVSSEPGALEEVPSESQDLVVMWDVIEHLKHPLRTVQEIRRILAPNGFLILTTGDIGSLGARLYGKHWHLLMPPYHLFYFDRSSIRKMLREARFDVRDIRGDGHPLENHGRHPLLAWIAKHDRHVGWRLNSGPIMMVTASAGDLRTQRAAQQNVVNLQPANTSG